MVNPAHDGPRRPEPESSPHPGKGPVRIPGAGEEGSPPRPLVGKKVRALTFLAAGATITEAARRTPCGRRSISRWLRQDAFRGRLNEAQEEVWRAVAETVRHRAYLGAFSLFERMVSTDDPRQRARLASNIGRLLGERGRTR